MQSVVLRTIEQPEWQSRIIKPWWIERVLPRYCMINGRERESGPVVEPYNPVISERYERVSAGIICANKSRWLNSQRFLPGLSPRPSVSFFLGISSEAALGIRAVVSKMPWFTLHGTMTQIVIIPFSRVWFKVTPTEVVWVVVRARLVIPRSRESFPHMAHDSISFKKSYRRYEVMFFCKYLDAHHPIHHT